MLSLSLSLFMPTNQIVSSFHADNTVWTLVASGDFEAKTTRQRPKILYNAAILRSGSEAFQTSEEIGAPIDHCSFCPKEQ